jgi:hypothetical protein
MTHMRTEIMEQPAALRATIEALPRAAEAGKLAAGTRQVLFIARGTSDNAAGLRQLPDPGVCGAAASTRALPGPALPDRPRGLSKITQTA